MVLEEYSKLIAEVFRNKKRIKTVAGMTKNFEAKDWVHQNLAHSKFCYITVFEVITEIKNQSTVRHYTCWIYVVDW